MQNHTEETIGLCVTKPRARNTKTVNKEKVDAGPDFTDTALVFDLLQEKLDLETLVRDGFGNRMEVQKSRD